jgi:large-conductance mechanosensitive channel|tara:strand:+ start:49 stop:438 length:390 start_codon:yes stop_codon:yes gene_type:complete
MQKKIKLPTNRNFGIVFFIVFLLIALWPLLNKNEIRDWCLAISLIFLALGLINSKLLTPLNKIWFKFGILLGSIISPVIMCLVFFLVITPTGIIMRLFRKDLLKLKENTSKTYWTNKDNNNKSSMRNQF